jgi:hypothetical protein
VVGEQAYADRDQPDCSTLAISSLSP